MEVLIGSFIEDDAENKVEMVQISAHSIREGG